MRSGAERIWTIDGHGSNPISLVGVALRDRPDAPLVAGHRCSKQKSALYRLLDQEALMAFRCYGIRAQWRRRTPNT